MNREQREFLEKLAKRGFQTTTPRKKSQAALKACLEELAAAERVVTQARGWLIWVKNQGSEFDGLPPAIEDYDRIRQYTEFNRPRT